MLRDYALSLTILTFVLIAYTTAVLLHKKPTDSATNASRSSLTASEAPAASAAVPTNSTAASTP